MKSQPVDDASQRCCVAVQTSSGCKYILPHSIRAPNRLLDKPLKGSHINFIVSFLGTPQQFSMHKYDLRQMVSLCCEFWYHTVIQNILRLSVYDIPNLGQHESYVYLIKIYLDLISVSTVQ